MLKQTLGLVCFLSASAFASGGTPGETVIYGSDDRLDFYQLQNSRDALLADSTVALFQIDKLTLNGGRYDIASDVFGRQYGLCPSERFYNQPSGAYCSGSLVGPDLVITAGHCIKNKLDCEATKFVFNYAILKEGVYPVSAPVDNVVGCKEIVAHKLERLGSDFSVIRLDRPITNHVPLKINRANDLKVGDKVGVIGHPGGLPAKIAFGESKVRSVDKPSYFQTNLDTYGGNSGSAVFNSNTGLVEGILVRGDNDFVYLNGCRVSNVCPVDGCRGEDVTRISEVAAIIPATTGNPEPPRKDPPKRRPGSRWPSGHVPRR